MSARDLVYLHPNGDRAELLVELGSIRVVRAPWSGPTERLTEAGYQDPRRLGRTFERQGYRPLRQEALTRALDRVADEALPHLERLPLPDGPWSRALASRAFVARLSTAERPDVRGLFRYVRARHGRILVLDGTGVSHSRGPLREWLLAIAHADDDLEELVFRSCRFHRDDADAMAAAAVRARRVAFVGGLPRDLTPWTDKARFTLACRPGGAVPEAAIDALEKGLANGVKPLELRIEFARDRPADEDSVQRLVRWLEARPPERLQHLALAGAPANLLLRLARPPLGPRLEAHLGTLRWGGTLRWEGALPDLNQLSGLRRLELRRVPFAREEPPLEVIELAPSEPPICPY